jgi:hypothetical protein
LIAKCRSRFYCTWFFCWGDIVREINVSRAWDPVHAGDKALTRETPAKRGRVNRYAWHLVFAWVYIFVLLFCFITYICFAGFSICFKISLDLVNLKLQTKAMYSIPVCMEYDLLVTSAEYVPLAFRPVKDVDLLIPVLYWSAGHSTVGLVLSVKQYKFLKYIHSINHKDNIETKTEECVYLSRTNYPQIAFHATKFNDSSILVLIIS